MNILRNYYCIKQQDIQDSGPACLATISKQYGLKLPISKIRELAGTDLQGSTVYGIIQAAEKLGFTAQAVQVEKKEELFDNLPTPCIAHVIMDEILLHFVVIHKITKNYILVADPGRGMMKYKPEDFFKIWDDILVFLTPTAKFQKGDQTKGLFQRFWGLIKVQKGLLINIFIASFLITFLGIAGSFYYRFLIDDILQNNLSANLHSLSIAMLVLLLSKIFTEFFRQILFIYMAQNIDVPLMLGYYNHVVKLPMNFFGTRKVGEIISRFNDGDKIRSAISSVTLTLMIDIIMAVAGGIILYMQNATLFFNCFIPIVLYLCLVFGFNFSGTIQDNMEFAADGVTKEMIIDACKKAHIHDFIQSQPMGYKTPLEEKGANLSGGQRQRLAIARALVRNPEIMIMDEATSNLDSITESAIQKTLEECTENVTTIIIAHRLSTIKKCDRIFVMDKGRIIEQGSHTELLKERGYYYKLWSEQSLGNSNNEGSVKKAKGGCNIAV